MHLPLRIAILECDTPLDRTRVKYGGYGGVFKSLLHSAAEAFDQPDLITPNDLIISYWDVVTAMEYPNPDDVDAILITGSRHDSFANNTWTNKLVEFTKQMLESQRVRIIGVCYGHQIIGRALGVPVGRNQKDWETAVTLVPMTEKGQELFGKEVLSIHQMHRDIVYEYPEGVEPLGSTDICHVQGMYAKNLLFTVQGHPEFNEQIMREILDARNKLKIFDEDVYVSAMKRVAKQHDGVLVGQAFLRFLLDD